MSNNILTNIRRTTVRAFSLGVVAGAFITAATITAIPAKADTGDAVYAYAATFGGAVCATLDSYPSFDGIVGIGKAIVEDGLTAYQAGEVIAVSVIEICPRHLALVKAFVNRNTSAAA